jgi:acetoin utilization deacetylase AcuC-like enzyme
MIVVYSPGYHIDIGAHVFPTRKYQLLHDRIQAAHPSAPVVQPQTASWQQLASVHTPEYLAKLQIGDFDFGELAQLEVPWSPEIVEGFRLMTGGTIEAARLALGGLPRRSSVADSAERGGLPRRSSVADPVERGGLPRRSSVADPVERGGPRRSSVADPAERRRVFHIGGGFHHAFADHGEGFCLFNDVAVAIRLLLADGAVTRAAVIDLDVHHGNGTARIFGEEARVFTFSMHQQNNYPADKPRGTLDVGLPDGATDDTYLEQLGRALPLVVAHAPQIAFYLAGADPYEDDQLGGLALTKSGLRTRDRLVLEACRAAGMAVVVLLAGGYARRLDDTVDIHYATFEEAERTKN